MVLLEAHVLDYDEEKPQKILPEELQKQLVEYVQEVMREQEAQHNKHLKHNKAEWARVENTGVLLAAGMIAGEALIGLLFASMAMGDLKYNEWLPSMSGIFPFPFYISLLVFGTIAWILVKFPIGSAGSPNDPAPPSAVH